MKYGHLLVLIEGIPNELHRIDDDVCAADVRRLADAMEHSGRRLRAVAELWRDVPAKVVSERRTPTTSRRAAA